MSLTSKPWSGRKIIPGYRFFHCEDCGHKWKEHCRDAQTPSISDCELCQAITAPYKFEFDGISDLKENTNDDRISNSHQE